MKVLNNEENREKLAWAIVDSWSLDDTQQYAVDRMVAYMGEYVGDGDFQEEWKEFYEEDGKEK